MDNATALIWTLGVATAGASAVWLATRCVRWAKKGTKGAALLVAVAFPNPDQPPPQQQVEDETRRKKDSESGDPERDTTKN